MDITLTVDEKRYLLVLARDSIAAEFGSGTPPPEATPSETLERSYGAFVTLRTAGRLRGCIGQIIPRGTLFRTIGAMARSSAFDDPRFPPLSAGELDRTLIEISVLSPLRRVGNPDRIAVGKHGLLIRRGFASGLLLPQVAVEQSWDRATFLAQTCRKAGLPVAALQDPATEIRVFTALVFSESAPGVFP